MPAVRLEGFIELDGYFVALCAAQQSDGWWSWVTGLREPGEDGRGRAIVTLSLSEPDVAQLGPEEIRARLHILPDIRWCAHWGDGNLPRRRRQLQSKLSWTTSTAGRQGMKRNSICDCP
jgi:hypothetical protein